MTQPHAKSTIPRRVRAAASAALVALVGLAARPAPAAGAEPAPADPDGFVVQLRNGGFVNGWPEDSPRSGIVRWRSSAFAEPLELATDIISSVRRLGPTVLPRPGGTNGFWLAGGDVVFGTLVALDDDKAVLEVPRFGRLHVERKVIHRIERLSDGADLVYVGPNGLEGWQGLARNAAWSEDAGQISSKQEGASLHADLGLPARACVEFEISWRTKADFVLALGVDGQEKNLARAFRFEVWDGQLVVHRETEREADVAPLLKVSSGPGRVHLLAYVDQQEGRIVVVSPHGKQLADLVVTGAMPQVFPGVHLTNVRGDVRLERLRIGRWGKELGRDRSLAEGRSRIQVTDGSVVAGRIRRYDAASKEYLVEGESGETRVAETRVSNVFLSTPAGEPSRAVLVADADGSRLSGDLLRIEKGDLCLAIPGIEESPRVPVSALRSFLILRHDRAQPLDDRSTRLLELDGVRLFGSLADGQERPGFSALAWRTLGCDSASTLRPGISGRIIKNWWDSPTTEAPQPPNNVLRAARPAPAVVPRATPSVPEVLSLPSQPRTIHLRTGDLIPAEVTKIDAQGVWIQSKLSDNQLVAHEKIQAVELEEDLGSIARLTTAKRDRLLTLPRMQKDNPPTHLIGSRGGDYLRGRLVSMDERVVRVEVRLETKEIPRDRITRIIWLRPSEPDPAAPAPKEDAKPAPAAPEQRTQVQALQQNGVRLTFFAERVSGSGKTLLGKSDVLGECRVGLADVEVLLLGNTIEQEASRLAYQQWTLKNAPDPRAVTAGEDGAGDGPDTVDSPLVGKPAPEFELELLGGKSFRLSSARGKVVVLDFWATWCGPCVRAMPQVEAVAKEFRDQGVQLVAVNLQETEKQISDMLERHKLDVTVALDRDGVVALKYAANAIPQTVVIDREGSVARLFIGGGPQLGDQLREAVRHALGAKDQPAEIRK